MIVELPEDLETALHQKAILCGVSSAEYVREVLHRDLESLLGTEGPVKPFKTSRGMLAQYGPAPTDEEMEENRRDMFRGFGEDF